MIDHFALSWQAFCITKFVLSANVLGKILNYLRYGQSTEDPDLFRGVKNLADYLGLTEMIKELESEQFVRGTDHGQSWVTLDLQGIHGITDCMISKWVWKMSIRHISDFLTFETAPVLLRY